jgi:tetratricopeptide (TPR) repeat protein
VLAASLLWPAAALYPILAAGLNTPMGEHRVVLAMIGPVMGVSYGLLRIESQRWRTASIALLLSGLALVAAIQTWPWRSGVTLWRHEIENDPGNARAWSFLADAYRNEGDLEQARGAVERAMVLAPGIPTLIGKAAIIEQQSGNLEGAAMLAAQVVALDDAFPEMRLLLAEALAIRGRLPEALAHANRAVQLEPSSSPAWNAVGNVLLMMGDAAAVEAYQRALQLDPKNREPALNLEKALHLKAFKEP